MFIPTEFDWVKVPVPLLGALRFTIVVGLPSMALSLLT